MLIDEEVVPLTLTEFKMLHFLASHPGVAYGRYDLLDRIGDGDSVVTDRTIDVHVRNLRKKLEPDPARPRLLLTEPGIGYRLKV